MRAEEGNEMHPHIGYIAWLAVLTLGLIYDIFRRGQFDERLKKLEDQVKALQGGSAQPPPAPR
jgi:hypothetical protein